MSQKFLSALVSLCAEHGVEINGDFAIWSESADTDEVPLLREVHSINRQGIEVGRRIERSLPHPWTQAQVWAYELGLHHALTGYINLEVADNYPAYYWLGVSHGSRKTRIAEDQS